MLVNLVDFSYQVGRLQILITSIIQQAHAVVMIQVRIYGINTDNIGSKLLEKRYVSRTGCIVGERIMVGLVKGRVLVWHILLVCYAFDEAGKYSNQLTLRWRLRPLHRVHTTENFWHLWIVSNRATMLERNSNTTLGARDNLSWWQQHGVYHLQLKHPPGRQEGRKASYWNATSLGDILAVGSVWRVERTERCVLVERW